MLTDNELRKAFCATNEAEPLANGWEELEHFARAVERLATESAARVCDDRAAMCALKADTADGEYITELKANAWQFSVLGAAIRKLVSNAELSGAAKRPLE